LFTLSFGAYRSDAFSLLVLHHLQCVKTKGREEKEEDKIITSPLVIQKQKTKKKVLSL
jgi:hypothetical protein